MPRKVKVSFLAAVCLLCLIAVSFVHFARSFTSNDTSHGEIITISGKEAQNLMEHHHNYAIVDVRTKAEFDESHVKGALNIDVNTIETDAPLLLPDRGQTIFLYCRSGNRSATAARILQKLGYTHIINFGAFKNWPGEVVSSTKS